MTNEELDEARANEALRVWGEQPLEDPGYCSFGVIAARLAREGWTPPEPVVDPDLVAGRAWCAEHFPGDRFGYLRGDYDSQVRIRAFIAGIKHGRQS